MLAKTFEGEYQQRTENSRLLFREALKVLPGGINANAKFFEPYPIYMKKARGSSLIDVDGNEYVDYCLAFGPLILGHGYPELMEEVRAKIEEYGTSLLGGPGEIEVLLAKRISELVPSAEMVRLTTTGNEATYCSIRVAKAFTKKRMVGKFEGNYHGWHDHACVSVFPDPKKAGPPTSPKGVPFSSGIPDTVVGDTLVLPFNDLSSCEKLISRYSSDLACVILEPYPRGFMAPDLDFLKGLREVTERNGVLLIFDEVVTGFRLGLRGAQGYFGVKPDLTALGKIVGGGFPVAAFAGSREIMGRVSPAYSKPEERVFHSGTHNGHSLGAAAGLKTLEILSRPGTYEKIDAVANSIRKGLREIVAEKRVTAQVQGISSIFHILFTDSEVKNFRDYSRADMKKLLEFDLGMMSRGIYLAPKHCCFTSLSHTQEDVDRMLRAAESVLESF